MRVQQVTTICNEWSTEWSCTELTLNQRCRPSCSTLNVDGNYTPSRRPEAADLMKPNTQLAGAGFVRIRSTESPFHRSFQGRRVPDWTMLRMHKNSQGIRSFSDITETLRHLRRKDNDQYTSVGRRWVSNMWKISSAAAAAQCLTPSGEHTAFPGPLTGGSIDVKTFYSRRICTFFFIDLQRFYF